MKPTWSTKHEVVAAAQLIRPLIGTQRPSIAVVLGSNGGSFAETLTNRAEIQYDRLERCGFAPP
ncbi:MAG: hypothetical protein ABIG71_01945, partial [Candidatus Uhrbacteria bacterium]